MRQYGLSEKQELNMAKTTVKNKIANQCALLKERKLARGMFKDKEDMFATWRRPNHMIRFGVLKEAPVGF